MTLKAESAAPIIKKIDGQCKVIIETISHRQTSKNLQEIQIWIQKQIENKFSSNQIHVIAILIDTIYQCFKKESDQNTTHLIEKCLATLIDNWNNLPEDTIHKIIGKLREYHSTNDLEAHAVLKEFVGKTPEALSIFRDISEKIISTCQFSLSKLSNTLNTEIHTFSAVKLATEADLAPFSVFKAPSPASFGNNPAKYKKKIKTRMIEFDENGIGYEFFYPYRCFLNDINLEIETPSKITKKIFRDELLRKELERLTKINANENSWKSKFKREMKIAEFDLFASQEQKEARQRIIEHKKENINKMRLRKKKSALLVPKVLHVLKWIDIYEKTFNSQSLSLHPFWFKTCEHDFLTEFHETINYEKFNELIKFSEYILISIEKLRGTIEKIDIFFKQLGFHSENISILDSNCREIKKNFNRETISDFLKNALHLVEQKNLSLDQNYCSLETPYREIKIEFSEPDFLDSFIASNNNKKIFKLLSNEIKQFFNRRRYHTKINSNYKMSIIKKMVSLFSEQYYLSNKKIKRKFIKMIFLNVSEPATVDTIKVVLNNLRWYQYSLLHVGIIFLLKKGFRGRLSEELYLDLLEDKFKKINEKKEPNIQSIDELYNIKNHINSLKNKIHDHSIDLNSINLFDSRQAIVNRLKSCKEIKHLLDTVVKLSNHVSNCVNQFNNLKNTCDRESAKIPESVHLPLNKYEVSKVHIPLKWTR